MKSARERTTMPPALTLDLLLLLVLVEGGPASLREKEWKERQGDRDHEQ
jgi:hypothetical protein